MPVKIRNILISVFVVVWALVFHYESLRYYYLDPLFKKDLPKVKFLFPPAGWIMFFYVDDQFGVTKVYGVKDGKSQQIDPHDIFRVPTIGFDNVHRNIMSTVSDKRMGQSFCNYLTRRYPYFDKYFIVGEYFPSITQEPLKQDSHLLYECTKSSP